MLDEADGARELPRIGGGTVTGGRLLAAIVAVWAWAGQPKYDALPGKNRQQAA